MVNCLSLPFPNAWLPDAKDKVLIIYVSTVHKVFFHGCDGLGSHHYKYVMNNILPRGACDLFENTRNMRLFDGTRCMLTMVSNQRRAAQ